MRAGPPIAIGLLVASGTLDPARVAGMAFLGELGLDGSLGGVPGTVVLAEALEGYRLVVPPDCTGEAVLAGPAGVRTAPTLGLLVDRLAGRRPWSGGPGSQPDGDGGRAGPAPGVAPRRSAGPRPRYAARGVGPG